jgi:hypothetical protein
VFRTSPLGFILTSPILLPFMGVLKLFRIKCPSGDPVPGELEISRLEVAEAEELMREHPPLGRVREQLVGIEIPFVGGYSIDNMIRPCRFIAHIDEPRSSYLVCYAMATPQKIMIWSDIVTAFQDDSSLTTTNSKTAAAIRRRPGARMQTVRSEDPRILRDAHLAELSRLRLEPKPVTREELIPRFCRAWRLTADYYVSVGLYVPDA